MNSCSSSSSSSLPFTSENHDTHDESWLLPGISTSFFCFACAIEGLEESSTLNIRKKKIVSELLEMLIVNNNVGKVIANKQDVYFHLLELYVNLLAGNLDEELGELVHQCCLHTVQQTNPLHAATIVIDNLIQTKKFAESGYLLKLACALLQTYPSICCEFSKKNSVYIDQIVQSTRSCDVDTTNTNVFSWHLISLLLQPGIANDMEIPRDIVEHILVGGLKFIRTSSATDVEIHIISCIKSLAQSVDFRTVLFEHENSKMTTKDQSIVEALKKLLLSTKEELEIAALECVSAICDPQYESDNADMPSLVSLVLEKGLSEFLFEMLASVGESVVSELFQCLQKLTNCYTFCSMGHMIYGFSAIVKAIAKMAKSANTEAFYHGVLLLETMLEQEGVFSNHLHQLTKQGPKILNILICGLDKPLAKLKHAVVACFCVYMNQSPSLVLTDHLASLNFLESVYRYIEKDVGVSNKEFDKSVIDFLVHSYSAVHRVACFLRKQFEKGEKIQSTDEQISSSGPTPDTIRSSYSSQHSSQQQPVDSELIDGIIHEIYYLSDTYIIPQAVVKLIPLKNLELQRIFFLTLLAVIELSKSKGQLISLKAAGSSFIKMTFDFKVFASQLSQDLDEVLGKLLLHFCSSVDAYLLNDGVRECLTRWFLPFNLPFNEWNFVLTKSNLMDSTISSQMTADFLMETRSCLFTLLVCSHKATVPMIPVETLRSHLSSFAEDKESLFLLPILGKRYFLYLWCHAVCTCADGELSSEQASQNVVRMVEAESERMDVLYMNADLILVWMLKSDISMVMPFCQLFFQDLVIGEAQCPSVENSSPDRMEPLLKLLSDNGVARRFMEVLVSCISCSDNELAAEQLTTLFASSLCTFSPSDVAYCKATIYKTFMMGGNKMEHFHFTSLFWCACQLEVKGNGHDKELHDEDIKLFCKCLTLLSEHSSPTLKLQLLNYINIVMAKSVRLRDGKPSSLLLSKPNILTDFERYLFSNENFLLSSQSSSIVETTNAVIILIVTHLMSGIQLLGEFSTHAIKVHINALVEGLACPSLPLLQLSLLSFWKEVFALKFHSPLLKSVDDTTEKEFVMTKNVARRIYVALQNLFLNERELIREYAIECIDSLLRHLKDPHFLLYQPWTRKLIKMSLQKLLLGEKDVPSMKLLASYVKHTEKCQQDVYNVAISMLKRCGDDFENHLSCVREIIELTEVVVKTHVTNIEYAALKELKDLLKSLHRKCCRDPVNEDTWWTYVVVEELALLKSTVSSVQLLETLRRTKNVVCERINSIDDETDSGDDGV